MWSRKFKILFFMLKTYHYIKKSFICNIFKWSLFILNEIYSCIYLINKYVCTGDNDQQLGKNILYLNKIIFLQTNQGKIFDQILTLSFKKKFHSIHEFSLFPENT